MRARIGVAASPGQVGQFPVHAVNRVYVAAIKSAGALPFVVPTLDPTDAAPVLAELDGLVLSGGGDLEPLTYGGERRDGLYGVDSERDAWELALVTAAEDLGVPVLGICRGLQAINVAAGGTLVPHLPDRTDQPHRVTERDSEVVHQVETVEGSLLRELAGPTFGVNSLHHQAADLIGSGLQVTGYAPDGVIEALENTRWGRTLGVQWHPELLTAMPEQAALWTWLVDAAGAWRTRRHGAPRVAAAAAGPRVGVDAGVAGRQPAALAVVPSSAPLPVQAERVA